MTTEEAATYLGMLVTTDTRETRLVGSCSGFTLVELLVVLAILVTVSGLVAPMFFNSGTMEVKAAARVVAAGLRKARGEAIAGNRPTAFAVDTKRHSFRLGDGGRERMFSEGLDVSLYTASSERVDEQVGAIRFYSDGSSTGGRVTLSNRKRTMYVDVAWETGRIRIMDAGVSNSGGGM